MKYIIRNCPAFVQSSYKNRDWAIENSCELIDDRCCLKQNCVMKQVVERCRKTVKIFSAESGTQPYAGGRCTEAEGILELLDIEEVE